MFNKTRKSFTNLAFVDTNKTAKKVTKNSRNLHSKEIYNPSIEPQNRSSLAYLQDSPDKSVMSNDRTLDRLNRLNSINQIHDKITQKYIGPDFKEDKIENLLKNSRSFAKENNYESFFDEHKKIYGDYKNNKRIHDHNEKLYPMLIEAKEKMDELKKIKNRLRNLPPDELDTDLITDLTNKRKKLEYSIETLSKDFDENFNYDNVSLEIKNIENNREKDKKYYELSKYKIFDSIISESRKDIYISLNYNMILSLSNKAEIKKFDENIDTFINDQTYNNYRDFVENIILNIEDIGKRLDLDLSDDDSTNVLHVVGAGVFIFFFAVFGIVGEKMKEGFSQNLETKEKYNLDYIKNDFNNMFIEFKKEFDNKLLNEPKIKKFENKLDEKTKFYLTNTKYSLYEIKKQFNFPTNIYELSEKQVLIFNSLTNNSKENLNYILLARDLYRRLNDEQKKKFLMLSEDQQNELVQMFIKEIKNQHVVIDSTKTKTINDLNNKITFNSKIITFYFVLVILIFIFFGFKLLTNKS